VITRLVSHLCRDERGIVLPVALGMVMVLTIALIGVLTFSSSSQRHSELSEAKQVARAVAEAGLNHAESVLASSSNPSSSTALPTAAAPGTASAIEGGTARYWGSLDTSLNPYRWTVTARSTVANPTGGDSLSHTVSAQFDVPPAVAPFHLAWNYVFSDAPGCTYYQNNVVIGAPVYTKGDMCIKNNAAVVGPKADAYGGIQLEDSGRVGTAPSDSSDPAVGARLGCRFGTGTPWRIPPLSPLPCPDTSLAVYRSSFTNAVPDLTKPPFDPTKRNTAKPGPFQYCTEGSFPGGPGAFTSTGAIDLMPDASYTCRVRQGSNLVGELSWDNIAKRLTVTGTIWFDGELVMDRTQQGTYTGQATIYFLRKINIKNLTELCAMPGCATSGWDPNTKLLVLISGDPALHSFDLQNFAKFQGAVYVVGGFKLQNNAVMHGPVIATVVDVQNNGLPDDWPPLTSLLDGMPRNSTTTWTVTPVPGSWRG
jgi:hypothetical protein